MFIDTHAHLLDNKFDKDRDSVISAAFKNGVEKIIEIGCGKSAWKETAEFAEKNRNIFFSIGLHPQEAKLWEEDDYLTLSELSKKPKCAGIGETGLDYHYEYSPREIQKRVFIHHLKLSRQANKPVICHCREAYEDFVDILSKDIKENGGMKGVVHCFSGNAIDAEKLIKMGFLLGIDGPLTYPKAYGLREVVMNTPLESIVLETDSPYLAPQKYRGKRNEPGYLPLIAESIAELKKLTLSQVEIATTENALKLFGVN